MKKLFKYIGIASFFLFSLYYTEKISNVVMNNTNLVKIIKENSKNFEVLPVSAIIDDEYIIPGLNGYTVNVLKSYDNMRFLDTFNSYYLEYDIIKPSISLSNNKEKIIKYGNAYKNAVAIVINKNDEIVNYAIEKNINITKIINKDNYNRTQVYEQINGDKDNYQIVEKMLNRDKINTNICYVNDSIINICKNENKYLVEASLILNSNNISEVKNNIKSGTIIYISDNAKLVDFKILIRQIYYQDLNIMRLSEIIREERD